MSQATVDLSCYVASVPQRVLLETLQRRLRSSSSEVARRLAETLELDTPPDFEGGHPVVVESWQVRPGAILFGGVDQEVWSRYAGTVWGAMAACTLPPFWRAACAAAASSSGLIEGTESSAFEAGSSEILRSAIATTLVGARGANRFTSASKEWVGSYREVIVLVPYVRLKAFEILASFVAGMHTDSDFARLIDRSLGYGFAKQPARIAHDAQGLQVSSITGRSQLRTSEERVSTHVVDTPDYWQQPLLGMASAGMLALSHLTRVPNHPALGIRARLHVEEDARWVLPRPDYRIVGSSLRDVRFELSAPQHLH